MPKSFLNISGYPLGLRNNNPGNIRTGDNWRGMIGSNQGFVVFENIGWGLRALGIDLSSKMYSGYDTIREIITRYAPPSENDTAAYISRVVSITGFSADRTLTADEPTLKRLMRAIITVENGASFGNLITDADITEGLAMIDNLPGGVVAGASVLSILLFGTAIYLLSTMEKMPKKRA